MRIENRVAGSLVVYAVAVCGAWAQSVWTGAGSGPEWSRDANWQSGVAPVPDPLTSLTFGGSVTQAQNDFTVGSTFSNLTFAAGASSFMLGGNGFSLSGNLANSSGARQRIAADVSWSGARRTLDTGSGELVLDGLFSEGNGLASFSKEGSGTLYFNGGGSFTTNDAANNMPRVNAGTVVITKDLVLNRLDLQNNARLIVTNNATLSGFTGNYVFWQACTVDLYSGKIVVGNTLLTAQAWDKTCNVNVRGGVFTMNEGINLRWANNGNTYLTLSGEGEFQWLAGSNYPLSENGGAAVIMNGGLFRRGSSGDGVFDAGHGSTKKSAGTITNRIDFNAGVFLAGGLVNGAKTNLASILYFNGGTLRAGKASTAFFGARPDLLVSKTGPGGLVFDTQGYTVTLNDAIESGDAPDGGLTKLGSGTLVLATNCTYTGATVVSNGLLNVQAPLASTALRLAPYTAANLASNALFTGALTVGRGASFGITPGITGALALAGLTLGDAQGRGRVLFEMTDGAESDRVDVTTAGALALSHGADVFLYQTGTTLPFSGTGTYPLFSYSGTLSGTADDLRVANPDPLKQYVFSDSGGVISLTISGGTGTRWRSVIDGAWSDADNWEGGVPDAVGAQAFFLTNAVAPLTVTLDADATAGSLIFSNGAAPYTLTGYQTLTLDAGPQQALLAALAGQHTVALPMTLASEAKALTSSGASLALAGTLSGAGPLTVTGPGDTVLTGTNQALTLLSDGALTIRDGASLAGGVAFDSGTLAVTQSTAIAVALDVGFRGAAVQASANATATLTASTQGAGLLRKTGAGTLSVSAPLGNAGGLSAEAGTVTFTQNVFGAASPLLLAGGTVSYTGTGPVSLDTPLTVSASSLLRTGQAGLTLTGPLDFPSAATLSLVSTNGVTLAGRATLSMTGSKLHLQHGLLRFAGGSDYTLFNGARDTLKLGQDANAPTEVVIESGARLKTGGIHMSATVDTATNCACVVRQEGGTVEVTSGEGLFIRDYGASAGTYLMNGGTFSAAINSWTSVGSKGPGYLAVSGGVMTLGRFALGVTDYSNYAWNGPGGHIAVTGGRLVIAGQCSWMSDSNRDRFNTVVLGNGTPGEGELDLVATTRSVPYANGGGRTALTFNGGLLKATGLAPYGSSALTNYLYGVDSLTIRSGGALIETPAADITVVQPLRAAGTSGGIVKRGAATLTLPSTNNVWCGLTEVQAGTLRARLNQAVQHLYPEGLLALWTFDDGTPADRSGNGFDLTQQNDTNLVAFVDGGFCGKAARFSGFSSLKMGYAQAFNINTYSISLWVKLALKDVGHQGFFSTRVDTGELGAGGTFDFKFNGSSYISCYNAAVGGAGASITAEQGGNLATDTWHMVTYVVRPGRTDAYLDGVWKNAMDALTPTLLTAGHILTIGRGHSSPTEPVREMMGNGGMIDDVAVFARALSADEIAAMYETAIPRVPVRVAEAATLDLLESTNLATEVSGGGTISNGTLVVTERLEPQGDGEVAALTVGHLVLGSTNLVYACTVTEQTNDMVRVSGALDVAETGTIDLGRTSLDPLATPLRRTVMLFGSIGTSDAQRLGRWKVTGDGITGKSVLRSVLVNTEKGQVDVELRFAGLIMLLR